MQTVFLRSISNETSHKFWEIQSYAIVNLLLIRDECEHYSSFCYESLTSFPSNLYASVSSKHNRSSGRVSPTQRESQPSIYR